MNEPLYLIMGATGATGSAAARELRKQGRRVRGLVHKDNARAEALRTSGAETVVGDLLDFDSILRAMEGVAARISRLFREAGWHRIMSSSLQNKLISNHKI